jgi:hypothetical protein
MLIWRAVFDLLPAEEPAGHVPAVWKTTRGGHVFVCERKADADEVSMRMPLVVDGSSVALWIAPLLRQAERDGGSPNLVKALGMVVAALEAADSGFALFERVNLELCELTMAVHHDAQKDGRTDGS